MSEPQTPPDSPPATAAPAPDTAAPAASAPPRAAAKPPAPPANITPSSGAAFFVVTLVIAVAGFAGLGFYALQQQRVLTRLAADYEALRQASSASELEIGALHQADGQTAETLRTQLQQIQDAQRAQLDSLNRELATLRTRVNDGGAAAGTALRVSEVEALLNLAQERLLSAHDLRAAISLMQNADELLRQVNDASMLAVREALAQDLTTLRAVNAVDVSGLYARLGAASTRLGQLMVQPGGEVPPFRVEETAADVSAAASWWDDMQGFLGRYFVITNSTAGVVPVLGTEQTWVVEEQLRLQLEEARLALLQGQQAVFERALDDAIAGTEALMQGADKPALLTELRALRASTVQTPLPQAASALEALRRLQPQEAVTP
jgi:uroporphyrin-3 C-methyltransferase